MPFMRRNSGDLDHARTELASLGEEAVVEVAGIVSNFQRMNRIANGTGIPIDPAANEKGEERRNAMNDALGNFRLPLGS